MKTETCKLQYSRVFWIFLPNFIKINLYNFELYRFKVGAFLRHSVVCSAVFTGCLSLWPGCHVGCVWCHYRWCHCVGSTASITAFCTHTTVHSTTTSLHWNSCCHCLIVLSPRANSWHTNRSVDTTLTVSHQSCCWCDGMECWCVDWTLSASSTDSSRMIAVIRRHYNDRSGVCFIPPGLLQLTAVRHQR